MKAEAQARSEKRDRRKVFMVGIARWKKGFD